MTVDVDIAIVGAGPVGLFAVFACGQLGMRACVIDALSDPGGQLTALYPEKPIYDIPSRPAVRADHLIDDLLAQAEPFDPVYLMGEQAETLLEDETGVFSLQTSSGKTVRARALLIAAGAGAFGPNRPPLDNIEDYEGQGVFYHVRRRDDFAGKRVVIAGGGDSAVDWALSLGDVAERVTVVHRRDKFRALPSSVDEMRNHPKIELMVPYQLSGLEGDGETLTGIKVTEMGGGELTLAADALIPLFGLSSDLKPLAAWGIDVGAKSIPVASASFETSRPGVFAAGDVAAYDGKLKLILSGFSEAAVAAHAAYGRVFPDQTLHFEHSTTKGAPGANKQPKELVS